MELSSANGVINVTNLSKILAHSPASLITINIQFFLAPSRLGKTFPHIWKKRENLPILTFLLMCHDENACENDWSWFVLVLMCDKRSNTLYSVPLSRVLMFCLICRTTEIFCPRVRSSRHMKRILIALQFGLRWKHRSYFWPVNFCVGNFRNFTNINVDFSFTSTYYMWCCFTLDRGVCTCEIKKIALIFTRILFSILKKILPCPCVSLHCFSHPPQRSPLCLNGGQWPCTLTCITRARHNHTYYKTPHNQKDVILFHIKV